MHMLKQSILAKTIPPQKPQENISNHNLALFKKIFVVSYQKLMPKISNTKYHSKLILRFLNILKSI